MTAVELTPGAPGGDLVVLAHGLEDSWESWHGLAGKLDPAWRIVALDLPWRPGTDYGWRARPAAAWLGAALDGVDRHPDLVIAHSYGANALLELLAAGDPRTGPAAVLVCPLYRPPAVALTWEVFDRSRTAFEQHIRDSVRSRLAPRLDQLDDDVVQAMVAKATDRVGPTGFLAVFEQFAASAAVPIEEITARVLVLAGGVDPTLSPRAASSLARRMPRAELLVDDGYDHFCHIRRPAEVGDRIRRFAAPAMAAPATPRRSGP